MDTGPIDMHTPERSWLPNPDGDFAMTIRTYWADEVIAKGDWLPPAVERTN